MSKAQKVSAPVWIDGNGNFVGGSLMGLGCDARPVNIVKQPSARPIPGHAPIGYIDTLFIKDEDLGGLYLNMTLEAWETLASNVSIAPAVWGGGGGSISLPSTQIAVGQPDNTIGSSENFTYNNTTNTLTVKGNAQYEPSSITFIGTGLDDMSIGDSQYNEKFPITYTITIDGTGTPDTFSWSSTDGSSNKNVAITGNPQDLSNDVTITFDNTTGHVLGDSWSFSYSLGLSVIGVVGNGGSSPGETALFGIVTPSPKGPEGASFGLLDFASPAWIFTVKDNNGIYLSIRPSIQNYAFGDIDGNNNRTYININDNNQSVEYYASNGVLSVDLSNLTDNRDRIEPDQDGTYALQENVLNKKTLTADGNTSFVLKAGNWFTAFAANPTDQNETISVGTTPGGIDIIPAGIYTQGTYSGSNSSTLAYYTDVNQTIYISGAAQHVIYQYVTTGL